MSSLILSEIHGPVGTITLNRPDRHNSLVPELLRQMLTALEALRDRQELRAVVVTAAGRSFSTGGDVLAFYEHLDADIAGYANDIVGCLNQVILTLIAFPKPIITAVHGLVTGGSIGLVAAADIVLVAPEASFTPYYNVVGYSPDGGWTAIVPRLIGEKRTSDVLLCNRTITGEEAVAWGLASRVVPADRIAEEAYGVAATIAQMQLGSVTHTKQLLRASYEDIAAGLDAERRHFVQQIATAEARRGMIKFLERRKGRSVEQSGAKGSTS